MSQFAHTRRDVEVIQAVRRIRKQSQVPYVSILFALAITVCFLIAVVLQIMHHQFQSVWDVLIPGNSWVSTDSKLGAITPSMFAKGEYWRLFTYMFVHIGVIHFLLNLSCFIALAEIEKVFGHTRFLMIYLISGIIGGACAWLLLLFFHEPFTAGASAAIYGVVCAESTVYLLHFRASPRPFYIQFALLLGIYIGFAFIGNPFGHLGGALTGIGLAWWFMPQIRERLLKGKKTTLNEA